MKNKEIIEINADEYLTSIGFNVVDLPILFNNDDKSYYTISELMESYLQYKSLGTIQTNNMEKLMIEHLYINKINLK